MDSNPIAEFLGIQTITECKFTLTVNSECSIKHNTNTQSTECKLQIQSVQLSIIQTHSLPLTLNTFKQIKQNQSKMKQNITYDFMAISW